MTTPAMKFNTMLCSKKKEHRHQILQSLLTWLMTQTADPVANACYSSLQEAFQVNTWADNKSFKDHYFWYMMSNHDSCVSFQEIVKAKLAVPTVKKEVPTTSAVNTINAPRKSIPKKIRGEVWEKHFGDSTQGSCYCCKIPLKIMDTWEAGHIVPHAHGGPDTADNLRPICVSCNRSMGTENMDAFKARCYPN